MKSGPTVPILGFEVALLGDALIALVAALAAALVQRGILALRPGRLLAPARKARP